MADGQDINDADLNLPQPNIDKSTFPGAGMPLKVPAAPKVDDSAQDAPVVPNPPLKNATKDDTAEPVSEEKPQRSRPMLSNVSAPEYADDNDLIEKEWVSKAKHIIDKTKSDPHIQSNELTLFKADYIKKRYNKTIKTDE